LHGAWDGFEAPLAQTAVGATSVLLLLIWLVLARRQLGLAAFPWAGRWSRRASDREGPCRRPTAGTLGRFRAAFE
jgi:hypothetical protein